MSRKRVFHLRLWGPKVEEGVDWEIEHHLQERIDELVEAGLTRKEAELQARAAFGDVARVRRQLRGIDRAVERRSRFSMWFDSVYQDVRYGARGLRRNPGFTAAIVLTLGLGIGANVSLFSIADALILRPLPYLRPAELYSPIIATPTDERGARYIRHEVADALLDRQNAFASAFMYSRASALYTAGAEPTMLVGEVVSAGFHETLGVWPVMGQAMRAQHAIPGSERVVLLSYTFWRDALGSDPAVIGKRMQLDTALYTVIGVMPDGFKFPEYSSTEFYVPMSDDGTAMGRKLGMLRVLGRIPPNRLERARAELGTIGSALLRETNPDTDRSIRLERYDYDRARGAGTLEPMFLLSGAVVFILLVAGVNMINLLLVRGTARAREFAVRLAIGASRARVIRQLATESFLLAALSGVAAVLIALLSLRAIASIIPTHITFFAPYAIEIESRSLVFTFVVTAIAAFGFGLLPAFAATRTARKGGGADLARYAARSPARSRLRASLVIAEVALSVTLLVAAGLLLRSFIALNQVDPGFEPEGLGFVQLSISHSAHPDPGERGEYIRRLEARIEAVPGVIGATLTGGMPPSGGGISFTNSIDVDGIGPRTTGETIVLPSSSIRADFFEVTGARLLLGRNIPDDEENTAIIDQHMARFLFGNADPIGRRFRIDEGWDWLTVVGVMKDLKLRGPDDRESNFEYLTGLGSLDKLGGYMLIAVRTQGDPTALFAALRAAIHSVDARQPIESLTTASDAYAESIDMPRFLLVILATIAALALLLAAIGIYGVLAFTVSQRTHELAVRVALGARAADLRRMIVRFGVGLALAGAGLGVVGALALSRFIQSQLYGVQADDPWTFATVLAAVTGATLLACLLPALRASSVQPGMVLRAD